MMNQQKAVTAAQISMQIQLNATHRCLGNTTFHHRYQWLPAAVRSLYYEDELEVMDPNSTVQTDVKTEAVLTTLVFGPDTYLVML